MPGPRERFGAIKKMAAFPCRFRLGLLLLVVLAVSPVRADWFQAGQDKMGTRIFVRLWHEDGVRAQQLLADAMAEVDRIEAAMSTYRVDSEISRVNRAAGEGWVPVSRELFDLIGQALELSSRTGGAFDITYDSLGQLYDFKRRARPSTDQVEAGLSAIDYRHVQLDADAVAIRFLHPDVRINLGGIAKGYAVESVIRRLRDAGISHALANAGGDTRVLGDRRDGPWVVGVREPDDEMQFVTKVALNDEAVSTSGDYEQFFVEDGVRYHHILNPSTGRSAGAVRSVTVIGPDATMTDGLSTSVFVMGSAAGIGLVESLPGYEVVVIDRDGEMRSTAGVRFH